MDDCKLLLTILSQKHLLKEITCNFSWKTLCNLSKAWRPFSEVINFTSNKKTIHFLDECITTCIIRSETCFDEPKIISDTHYSKNSLNYRNVDRMTISIYVIDDLPFTPNIIENFKRQIDTILETVPYLRKLTFCFQLDVFTFFANHLINEIKNDKVTEITLVVGNSYSDKSWTSKFQITNNKIFNGFKNLSKIKLYIEDLSIYVKDKVLIDIIGNIKGITIEISLGRLPNDKFSSTHSSTIANCVLSYILTKKIFLSINVPFYKITIKLNEWFRKLEISNFIFIRSLRFHVSSIIELIEFSKYLCYMENLEWLGIIFNINYTSLKLEENMYMGLKKYLYESSKHLQKLKTIQISWYFNSKNLNIKKFMENQSLEHQNINKQKSQLNTKCLKIWQEQIFLFLSCLPKSIQKLYFHAFPEFTNTITSTLNNSFPNLNFLYLSSIPKTEVGCLMNFSNLKIYVSNYMNVLELPDNIESCMIFDVPYCLKNNTRMKKYDTCTDYYRNLKYFNNEYVLDSQINGTIFFNYFHELYDIQNHFDDIYKMYKWYDKFEKGY